jgi:hypothetical protein
MAIAPDAFSRDNTIFSLVRIAAATTMSSSTTNAQYASAAGDDAPATP